jgi:hypothetical protein
MSNLKVVIDNKETVVENLAVEYFNGEYDGINNLTIKIDQDSIVIESSDDQCNSFKVRTITFDYLLQLADRNINV